jgi:undecaprenyl phosphate N,N'-diacetylbacillosamine 1-phosphate transferase
MSLVGPRPLLPEYLAVYRPEERERHTVRPGLTGLAQTSGRNLQSWDDRLQTDLRYVHTVTFFGDVRILAATARIVINGAGVSNSEDRAMTRLDEERTSVVRAASPTHSHTESVQTP